MSILVHIADRALNRPLLITPEKAAVIMSVLAGRIGIDATGLNPDASRFVGSNSRTDESGRERFTPFKATRDGVGIITIAGSLVNRGAWIGASSGLVSYEGIKFQLQSALNDPGTHSVILDLASPGGEAVGAFEVADMVRQLAAKKRTVAVVNGMAASAAYAIASGATEIVTTESGVSGSIGVVLLHADYSEALAEDGIKPTLIFAGAHKVDGNPFEPLPDAVRADLQAEVDAFYKQFLGTVAKGRGARMTVEKARATEARTFIGAGAVAVGLADRVGTFESVLSELSSRAAVKGRSTSHKGVSMSDHTGAPAAENAGLSKADLDKAATSARAEGYKAGAADATARIKTILTHDAAKGREAQAQVLAFETDMPAEASVKVLEASAKATTTPSLAQRQAANPANTIGTVADSGKPAVKIDAAAIYARRAAQR